jgi:hypothetical protein
MSAILICLALAGQTFEPGDLVTTHLKASLFGPQLHVPAGTSAAAYSRLEDYLIAGDRAGFDELEAQRLVLRLPPSTNLRVIRYYGGFELPACEARVDRPGHATHNRLVWVSAMFLKMRR